MCNYHGLQAVCSPDLETLFHLEEISLTTRDMLMQAHDPRCLKCGCRPFREADSCRCSAANQYAVLASLYMLRFLAAPAIRQVCKHVQLHAI